MIQDLKERFQLFAVAALLGVLLLMPLFVMPAHSQTMTVVWQLSQGADKISNHDTQAQCDAAAKAHGKAIAVTYACTRLLMYKPAAGATVVTPPVVLAPPVTVPPVVAPASSAWVVGQSTASEPTTARPARGAASVDTFGQQVFRVTDRADPPTGFARNDYSRRQAFNADNTRQLVSALDGYWHTYNAVTFAYEKRLPGLAGDAEPQWHPTNPDLLYYLGNNGVGLRLQELNVTTGVTRTVGDFAARLKARWPTATFAWTKSEGSPSADGRYWCFMVDDAGFNAVGIFTWDLQTDTIIGTLNNTDRPDHVSMSPSGNYCVVSGDSARGTVAYSRDFSTSRKLLAKSEHSDLALLPNGDDAYVSVDYQSGAGDVFFTNVRTGERSTLFPSYLAGTARAFHFSGKAYNVPGWALVSTYGDTGTPQWMDRKVFFVELKAGGRILNVAWHRRAAPASEAYFFEPHATVSRDGRRVAFTSSWGGTANGDINAYQVRLQVLP